MANTPISAHDNPIMLGVNSHIPAHQPSQGLPCFPPVVAPSQQSWSSSVRQEFTFVPVAPVTRSFDQSQWQQQHVKRVRECQQQQQPVSYSMQEEESYIPVSDGMASPSHGKKQRQSNYRPPQQVDKKSVIAVTGSLVGGGWEQNRTTVRMRRELSGGQLDQFFRDHDAMEVDGTHRAEMRPRSMSL